MGDRTQSHCQIPSPKHFPYIIQEPPQNNPVWLAYGAQSRIRAQTQLGSVTIPRSHRQPSTEMVQICWFFCLQSPSSIKKKKKKNLLSLEAVTQTNWCPGKGAPRLLSRSFHFHVSLQHPPQLPARGTSSANVNGIERRPATDSFLSLQGELALPLSHFLGQAGKFQKSNRPQSLSCY